MIPERPRARSVFLLAALTLLPGLAGASKVRTLNLEELTQRAQRIFSGTCTELRVVEDPVLGLPVTEATFAVSQSIKGAGQSTVTIRQIGSAPDGRSHIAGLPEYAPGEEVVLFLYGVSDAGLTSPVGMMQGKFSVQQDKQGQRVVVNGDGNRHLMRELSPSARDKLGLSGDASSRTARGGVIQRDRFLDMVRVLLPEQSAP